MGGFVGSSFRFILSGWVHRLLPMSIFPFGTLTVNTLGCLAIGFLGGLAELKQLFGFYPRLFIMIGLLGGFTTFSTFSYETLGLAQESQFFKAVVYVMAHLVLGFSAALAGYIGAKYIS